MIKEIASESQEALDMNKFDQQDLEVFMAFTDIFIVKKIERRGCLWLHGIARTGKTTYLKMAESLLPSCELDL